MKATVKAAAKINLLLDFTATLENGYHSIYTVMQSVDIFDTVSVEATDEGKITLTCSDKAIPTGEKNTAVKAALEFFAFTGLVNKGLKIHIDKVIPTQAGMAGGSADAAAVIKALDTIYGTKLSETDMLKIGEKVGSDVPFCISGGTRLCLNKGEVMAPLPPLPECWFVIVKPSQGVSTKDAYGSYDAESWIRHPDNSGFLYAATQGDLKTMCAKAANVFEQAIEVTDRVKIKSAMRGAGAGLAMMTGSGSAVFGLFYDREAAEKCRQELKCSFETVFVSKPTEKALYIL